MVLSLRWKPVCQRTAGTSKKAQTLPRCDSVFAPEESMAWTGVIAKSQIESMGIELARLSSFQTVAMN